MNPIPVNARLLDFGMPSPPRAIVACDATMNTSPVPASAGPPAEPVEDIATAYLRGLCEGKRIAENEFATLRSELRTQHAIECSARLAAAASGLAERIDAQLSELFRSVSASAAQALAPVLRTRVRDCAMASITEKLGRVLIGKSGLTIRIEGPAGMLEALGAHPALAGHLLDLWPSEQVDVKITIDRLLLETQIAGWLSCIEDHQ